MHSRTPVRYVVKLAVLMLSLLQREEYNTASHGVRLESVKPAVQPCPTPQTKTKVLKDMIFPLCEKLGQTIIFVRTRETARALHAAVRPLLPPLSARRLLLSSEPSRAALCIRSSAVRLAEADCLPAFVSRLLH